MKYLKVFTDFREFMELLTDEEKGRLFEGMLLYAEDGTAPDLDGNEKFVWAMARRIIDREAEVYESKVEAGREGGKKRTEARRSSREQPEAAASTPRQDPQEKEYENEKEQEKEKEKEHEKDPLQENVCVSKERDEPSDTHPPTREEIKRYCQERQNGIDPDYFFNYYAAAGWRLGQHPVRDWKALVQTWEKGNADAPSGPGVRDAVRKMVDMAQSNRQARQRNTLMNYREEPSHASLESIAFSEDDL